MHNLRILQIALFIKVFIVHPTKSHMLEVLDFIKFIKILSIKGKKLSNILQISSNATQHYKKHAYLNSDT